MLFDKTHGTSNLKWRLIGRTGKTLIDLIFIGARIRVRGHKPIQPLLDSRRCIFAFWHARILMVSYYHKGWGAAIMVSDSADGEIIAQILQRQKHVTVRGSTGKGGNRAIVRMIKEMKRGRRCGGVVPDGPQGPRHIVQPGVVYLAQKTGYPIIPVTYSAQRRILLNSWDRFLIPHPGTDCLMIYGRPLQVPAQLDEVRLNQHTKILETELMRITQEADRFYGHRLE